ncbi:phosphatase, putative [Leishmania panamensis]|uniref:Phosphatase, putative n=1 Tax=Leishmania panamensis TaxID=5679 RepID=A0A088RKD1_LEIPA|nr:phosphatase, putative [Leishmania panamensis]AIN95619.1 phosphatase, putative [Leishmania panamensis]
MKGIGRQSFLVVFDFDHTIVDCNTDVVIPAALGRRDMQHRLMLEEDRMQWTKLMDTIIAPFHKDELKKAAHDAVTIDPAMPEVFRYLVDAQRQYAHRQATPVSMSPDDARTASVQDNMPGFVEMNIASDANLLFIEAALDARFPGLKARVSQIHSNPYYDLTAPGVLQDAGLDIYYGVDRPDGRLNVNDEAERDAAHNQGMTRKSRVSWYEPYGHQCQCCLAGGKPNMCKSIIIERLLQTTSLIDPTIIFIGDGANDYCPVLNVLRPRDYMFARRDFPIHHILAGTLHPTLSKDGAPGDVGGCCHVGLWKDAAELRGLFQLAMEHPGARLPTLVRFRDVAAKEFRSVTIAKRIPSVLKRTFEELSNASGISEKGRQRIVELMRDAEANSRVPPLPGQACVPAWLRNYAYVSEYDNVNADDVARRVSPAAEGKEHLVAPRWGQVPWLHGEIYFYHLMWQYFMMQDTAEGAVEEDATATTETAFTFNVVTPHAVHNPLFSQECRVTSTLGVISPPVIVMQSARDVAPLVCRPASIADGVIARRVQFGSDGPAKQLPYMEMVRQPSGCVIPPAATFFSQYRDIFAREKHDVLMNFLKVRVVPMLACQPWGADRDYGGILLRWMLWGNGIDLSMFTLDQLASSHGKAEGSDETSHSGDLAALREVEKAASLAQDANLVGNEVAKVVAHLQRLLDPDDACNGTRQVDIVMDNVGVECIADLCFGLWYVNQAARLGAAAAAGSARVVYHVKSMPYYVSDVTPRDFDLTLAQLEGTYTNEAFEPDSTKRETLKAVLEPFIAQVRDCFARGAFAVDADTVWTQPSEYRDLPPRVINRYFFTQQISAPALADDAAATTAESGVAAALADTACPASSAAGPHCMSKTHVQARSGLVLFKGDLNYRRLIGDRYWDRTDFLTALAKEEKPDLRRMPEKYSAVEQAIVAELTQDTPTSALMDSPTFAEVMAAYWPTQTVPVCSIRTIKSECCLGVPGDLKTRLDQEVGLSWRISGKYGVILFACGEQ